MMDDFTPATIETAETGIFVRWSGSGPPVLLLHGFPETHLMWRGVAPLLARNFTVICAELGAQGPLDTWYVAVSGPIARWQAWSDDVQGHRLKAGHFFPEEVTEQTAEGLGGFFGVSG
jgi:alpha-beta hydrolase superfamily lysophospholipase